MATFRIVTRFIFDSEPVEIELDPKDVADYDLSVEVQDDSLYGEAPPHSVVLLDEDDNVVNEYLCESS